MIKQGRKRIFSIMDLKDAFHQIPLKEESRTITNTSTPKGMQQWRVVLQGWKNGVQYCQRNIEVTLDPVCDVSCGYVDDILTGTDDGGTMPIPELLAQHDRVIRRVLEALKDEEWVVD